MDWLQANLSNIWKLTEAKLQGFASKQQEMEKTESLVALRHKDLNDDVMQAVRAQSKCWRLVSATITPNSSSLSVKKKKRVLGIFVFETDQLWRPS